MQTVTNLLDGTSSLALFLVGEEATPATQFSLLVSLLLKLDEWDLAATWWLGARLSENFDFLMDIDDGFEMHASCLGGCQYSQTYDSFFIGVRLGKDVGEVQY